MQTLQIDPEFQSLVPPLSEDERAELEASLLAEGCRDALVVWAGKGVLLDGHTRYAICQKHGIEFRIEEMPLESRDHAIIWIVRNQIGRRNVSQFAKDELVINALKPALERIGLARKKTARSNDPGNDVSQCDTSLDSDLLPHKTDAKLAKEADTSEAGIRQSAFISKNAPENVKEAARRQEISRRRAYEITRAIQELPEADRARAAEICIDHDEKARTLVRLHKSQATDPDSNGTYEEILRTGGFHYGDELEKWCDFKAADVSEINEALRSLAKHHKLEAMRRKREDAPPLPEGKYDLILSDPPWRYEHVKTESRAIENQYPTMTLDEICALPVADLAADDAVLFLWATSPKLAEALRVIEAWGFTYRTCMVWVKDKIGMGYYARQRHELLLIATRGTPGTPLPADREDSVIEAPRRAHSEKPKEAYEAIERMYPFAKKVELFARAGREGWSSWGNEVDAEAA